MAFTATHVAFQIPATAAGTASWGKGRIMATPTPNADLTRER
jgi:hypothetical protein